jgi:hypothetical protein
MLPVACYPFATATERKPPMFTIAEREAEYRTLRAKVIAELGPAPNDPGAYTDWMIAVSDALHPHIEALCRPSGAVDPDA